MSVLIYLQQLLPALRSVLSTLAVFISLLMILVLERQYGWPLITVMLSFQVFDQSSSATQLIFGIALGLYLATAYLLPLWWGVALFGSLFLLTRLVSESRRRLLQWGLSLLVVGMLFIVQKDPSLWKVTLIQIGLLLLVQIGWQFGHWWWIKATALTPSTRLKRELSNKRYS